MTTAPTTDIRLLLDLELFDGVLGGQAWEPGQSELPEAVRTSLIVNLLTEDNLPSHHRVIAERFGRDGAWDTWVHRWTPEEDRHGQVIRDYLPATRAVDPVALERARTAHMTTGFERDHMRAAEAIAYVSFQELATRVAHRNTGRFSGDPVCERMPARVAQDENLHMLFHRDLLDATFDLTPDAAMRAVTTVVTSFRMPGHGIDNFARKPTQIALAGIYDLRLHHDEVLMPVLRRLGVFERSGLGPDGERARDALAEYLTGLDRTARRFTERCEAAPHHAASTDYRARAGDAGMRATGRTWQK